MTADRIPLPAAYADPAFIQCLMNAIEQPDLIDQFDGLYQVSLFERRTLIRNLITTGEAEHEVRRFAHFVHCYSYCHASDDAIHAMREAAKVGA